MPAAQQQMNPPTASEEARPAGAPGRPETTAGVAPGAVPGAVPEASPPARPARPAATRAAAARDRDLAAAAPYRADWQAFREELPAGEPAALQELRRAAIERFAALGFPTTRQEEWRFTNVAPLARAAFRRAAPPPPSGQARFTPADLAPWTFAAAARLVFVDGHFAPELSAVDGLGGASAGPSGSSGAAGSPGSTGSTGSTGSKGSDGAEGSRDSAGSGVVVENLAAALARDPRRVTAHLGRHAPAGEQPFVDLNTAFLRDGACVLIPRRMTLDLPIHLLYLSTPGGAAGTAPPPLAAGAAAGDGGAPAAPVSYPRNLIVAAEGSAVTVVETYAGEGVYFSCGVTELIAEPGATIDHYKVQRESRDAFHLATLQVYGDRASVISSHSISIGGGLVRNDVNALLDGEGIDCILNGLYLADGRQLVDNHMRVEHAKPHCASHELYKGILDGRARSVFNGLIHVHPGAQKTDAKQSNRNLLLSPDAIANSNPQLEIFADDVRCTHGSTVGQLDDDAVFYLRSRGIGEAAARSLLTYAFASDILARIKVEAVRHDLEEFLFARLPQGEVVRQAV